MELQYVGPRGTTVHFFVLVVLPLAIATAAVAAPQAKPGCRSTCGDVEIPYPFGTSPDCFLSEDFFINCTSSNATDPPRTYLRRSNILVTNITDDGQLYVRNTAAKACYKDGRLVRGRRRPTFSLSEFTISNTENKFIVTGCDSYAIVRGWIGQQQYAAGCISLCNNSDYITDGSCIGTGCCQIDIPEGLRRITVRAYSLNNHTEVSYFNPCTYGFIVQQRKFNFSRSYLGDIVGAKFPMVLDWSITNNGSCDKTNSTSSSVCGKNASCYKSSQKYSGYLCRCNEGYKGNPYLSDGCQDINECDTDHNCEHECVNKDGNYSCVCRKGYHGDGRKDGEGCVRNNFPVLEVILGVGITFAILLLSSSWLYLVLKRRKLIKLKEKFFQQNGGFLLQRELSKRSGSSDTAKIFTAEELEKATDNYAVDRIIGRGGYGTVYKGYLADNNEVAIKKSKIVDQSQIEQFINEVVVLSQINHRNVVRLLGCCLETEVPLLVYEFVSNGTLFEHIHSRDKAPTISWEIRLRIAAETAEVLSYLHSAASTPIIHRDVKSTNILLDNNYTAKVSDFGASKLVPIDETQLSTMVQGTLGYLDPEYLHTSQLTEKSDVYSFGVVLLELLTGKKALLFDKPEEERSLVMYFLSSLKEDCLFEILENHNVRDDNKEQLKEVAELAAGCLKVRGEERPTMKEVAMELEGLRMMRKHSWDNPKLNAEETEYLLRESLDVYKCGDSSNTTAGYDSIKDHALVAFDDGR